MEPGSSNQGETSACRACAFWTLHTLVTACLSACLVVASVLLTRLELFPGDTELLAGPGTAGGGGRQESGPPVVAGAFEPIVARMCGSDELHLDGASDGAPSWVNFTSLTLLQGGVAPVEGSEGGGSHFAGLRVYETGTYRTDAYLGNIDATLTVYRYLRLAIATNGIVDALGLDGVESRTVTQTQDAFLTASFLHRFNASDVVSLQVQARTVLGDPLIVQASDDGACNRYLLLTRAG